MKNLFLTAFLTFALPAFANSPISTSTIAGLTIHDFGNQVFITLDAPAMNSEGCQLNNILVLEKTNPFFTEIYSALLVTYMRGGKFAGWVNGCEPIAGGAPILTRLDLRK